MDEGCEVDDMVVDREVEALAIVGSDDESRVTTGCVGGNGRNKKAERHRRVVALYAMYAAVYHTGADERRGDLDVEIDCGDEGVQQQMIGMVYWSSRAYWLSEVCDPGAARQWACEYQVRGGNVQYRERERLEDVPRCRCRRRCGWARGTPAARGKYLVYRGREKGRCGDGEE